MFGKMLALLAVPLGFVAYSSLAKASPKTPAGSFDVRGKSGIAWRVVRVNQFQQPDGLLTINDVMTGDRNVPGSFTRVVRYSQLGSALSTRKYITSPFDAGMVPAHSSNARKLSQAAEDFGIVLPPALLAKVKAAGG